MTEPAVRGSDSQSVKVKDPILRPGLLLWLPGPDIATLLHSQVLGTSTGALVRYAELGATH